MPKLGLGGVVDLHEREGGRRHIFGHGQERLYQGAREMGFSGADRARKQEHVARTKLAAQFGGEGGGFLGGVEGDLDGRAGHGAKIPSRPAAASLS